MRKLLINVKARIATSPEIAWDIAQDYTHFLFAHRRNFAAFEVLHDDGELQIFFYVSRPFPFLPFGMRFVSVRKLNHESMSLNQIYKGVDGRNAEPVRFHFQVNPRSSKEVEWDGTYLYPVRGALALFPGLFTKLFVRRIRRVWREDEEMMTARHQLGPTTQPSCQPFQNPILSNELIESLDAIENLKSQKEDPGTTFFEFPAPR